MKKQSKEHFQKFNGLVGENDRQYILLTYIHMNPHFPGFIQVLQ